MTKAQARFVQLEKQKDAVKKFHEEFSEAIQEVQKEVGLNGMFQDQDGTVYKIVKPNGRWVDYEDSSYLRTRRLDEEKSPRPLSLSEAEGAGFTVQKKK